MKHRVRIREVYKKRGTTYGETTSKWSKRHHQFFDIYVNKAQCKWYFSVFTTLFHELLHLGFNILEKMYGIKYTYQSEEELCEKMEDWLLINFKTLKKAKRSK